MVEGYANITIKGVTETVRLSALELATIVTNRRGFQVIDAEPTGTGNAWRIRAHGGVLEHTGGPVASVTANGSSLTAAVSSLIESIW
jgi:hypothetical protein